MVLSLEKRISALSAEAKFWSSLTPLRHFIKVCDDDDVGEDVDLGVDGIAIFPGLGLDTDPALFFPL